MSASRHEDDHSRRAHGARGAPVALPDEGVRAARAGGRRGAGVIGVLISGRGSNMVALAEACAAGRIPARVGAVISDDPAAPGLAEAARRGLATGAIDRRRFPGRQEHEAEVIAALRRRGVDLVCLAGYMRLLSAGFVREFPGRILNVHPALLPSFPGLHAPRQAVEHGVRVSGATVHFVDEGLDSGPIVMQAAVPVEPDDTEESLAARILKEEHRIYPETVRLYFEGRLRIEGRRVRIAGR